MREPDEDERSLERRPRHTPRSREADQPELSVDREARVVAFEVHGLAARRALRAEATLTRARRAWGLPDHPASRRVELTRARGEERARVELFVPELLGGLELAEVRGEHVVVRCTEGLLAYEAGSDDEVARPRSPIESCGRAPRRGPEDPGRPRKVPGLIAWHSLLKVLRTRVFAPEIADRVSFVLTHHRRTGGRAGVAGRVEIDDGVIVHLAHATRPGALSAHHLVAALSTALFVAPEEAHRGRHPLLASIALLDRRLASSVVEAAPPIDGAPLWSAFRALRLGGGWG